jgi:energy-coupling factor transport system permease protein
MTRPASSTGKFDPRTKLFLAILYAGGVICVQGMGELITLFGGLLLLIAGMLETKAYLRWLRLVLPMSIFLGTVIWWTDDLHSGIFSALKLLALASAFFAFFRRTDPEELGNALIQMGLPYPLVFVLSTGLRFVPVMGRKVKDVMDAQRARGIPLEPGWKALRHYPAFLAPILIQAFQQAEELAESMEARGFGLPGRTSLHEYRMGFRDWFAIGTALLLSIGLLILRF